MRPWLWSPAPHKNGCGRHACNLCTREAKQENCRYKIILGYIREFRFSLGYKTPCLKKQKANKHKRGGEEKQNLGSEVSQILFTVRFLKTAPPLTGLEKEGYLGVHTPASLGIPYSLHLLFMYLMSLWNNKNEVDLLDANPIPEKLARKYGDQSCPLTLGITDRERVYSV